MKKKILIVLLVVILAAALGTGIYFIAKSQLPDNSEGVTFTLVLRDLDGKDTLYEISTEKATLFEVLEEQKEKGKIDLNYSGSGENTFLLKIGTLDSTAYEQGWLALYTSIAEDDERSDVALSNASWGTVSYKENTLNSCAFGATKMPIYQSVIYLIELKQGW